MAHRRLTAAKGAQAGKGLRVRKSAKKVRGTIKMVQVHADTHARLTALKIPGLTMEDVINLGLDQLSQDDIARHYAHWQENAMATLSAVATPIRPRAPVAAKS